MPQSLFITGASGFIGRRLLARLNTRSYDVIYCLSRHEHSSGRPEPAANVRWLKGTIFDDSVYGHALGASDTIIHLAATTGKATREQHFRTNAHGTRHFVNACRRHRVRKILHVSTIAVKYLNIARYDYARSKREAEEAVTRSGLDFTIVRPTIVLGKDSPTWRALFALARLPLVPVVGDGTALIQPIEVDDLVDAMISLVQTKGFANQHLELGGREVVPIETFLRKVHSLYHATTARVVHIPSGAVSWTLAMADRYAPGLLPFTAGQMSVFVEDGTAEANQLGEERRAQMKDLRSMLDHLISHEQSVN